MKGFFAGALFAAPLTAIVLWLVVGMQSTIDTKVERGVAASNLAQAEFSESFNSKWEQLGGGSALGCSEGGAQKVTELQQKLDALEIQLTEQRIANEERATSINDIVVSKKESK